MERLMKIRRLIYLSALLSLALAVLLQFSPAKADDEVVSYSLFIPVALNGPSGNGGNGGNNPPPPPPPSPSPTPTSPTPTPPTPTPTPPTPTPPAESVAWQFFADPKWNTNSASIATDSKGGIHLAYHYYEAAGDGAPRNGVYQYCPSACDKAASWTSLAIGENVNEIQLELTAEGNPRILYRVSSSDNGQIFYYAECNQNCTQAANWAGAAVFSNMGMATLEFSDDDQPQRYFELDPQGHPRFIYNDYNYSADPDHIGTFYAYCDSGCMAASNWSETKINKDNGGVGPYRSEDLYYPVLAFTPAGQPRVLADGYTMNDESGLHYVACDSACEDPANWQSALLWERGSGTNVTYDIETDAQGRVRVAYYDGQRLNSEGNWLYYGWCNQGCTNAANWDRYDFGFNSGEGQEPDLELDAEGKPHIAFIIDSTNGLAYGRCIADCESHQSQWTHVGVESGNDLESAWNVAYPPHCDGGFWQGLTPTLSLDKDGSAAFAYDGTYNARCWYNNELKQWEVYPYVHLIQRSVRTYFLP